METVLKLVELLHFGQEIKNKLVEFPAVILLQVSQELFLLLGLVFLVGCRKFRLGKDQVRNRFFMQVLKAVPCIRNRYPEVLLNQTLKVLFLPVFDIFLFFDRVLEDLLVHANESCFLQRILLCFKLSFDPFQHQVEINQVQVLTQ